MWNLSCDPEVFETALARDGAGLALVPPVVVAGELKRGQLVEYHRFSEIRESFYAISPSRQFPNPLVAELIEKAAETRRGAPKGNR